MKEVYFDSNLFIAAVIEKETSSGINARLLIDKVAHGEYKAYTASLTFDEVLWIIQRTANREIAAQAVDFFLSLPHLHCIDVTTEVISLAVRIYKERSIDPRDAIHIAAMQSRNLTVIFSADSDLDRVKGIKRIDFSR